MKEQLCDVIITYSWNRVGYNILRSLAEKGCNVWTADTSRNNICSYSSYVNGSFIYPDPFKYEDEFIKCLKEQIVKLNPKVLFPTHDESIIIMRHRDELPNDLVIPYSNADLLSNLSDKKWSTDLADKCSIPIPKVFSCAEEIDSYPCIFKTSIGNSAKTVFSPNNRDQLISLIEKFNGENYLIEEWIPGMDYCVDCIRWGDSFYSSVYRSNITKTKGGGTSTQREIVEMPLLEQYSKELLDSVSFEGVCGIDYRFDSTTGRVAFIEVNARFTGGIATPITAGFDIPWILYCLATTGSYDEPIDIKIGTKTKWILGDIITLVGRCKSLDFNWKELKQILSYRGFDAFDDYRSDDRKAFLGELNYYFSKLIKSGKLNP